MNGLYHVGFTVPDIDAAIAELQRTLAVDISPPRPRRIGDWTVHVALSVHGPPFLELLEGPVGSPWHSPSEPRFDHLGLWSADPAQDRDLLIGNGCGITLDGAALGMPITIHKVPALGTKIEVVDASVRARLLADRIPTDPHATVLHLQNEMGQAC